MAAEKFKEYKKHGLGSISRPDSISLTVFRSERRQGLDMCGMRIDIQDKLDGL